ncbi:Protein SIS1 [Durusdinium trenchii]|uniref:Protein SIS1 n=1 Tax=Durusdinium trenchii TaxID=1381693 RepID=A0ABP0J1Q6_9DINO
MQPNADGIQLAAGDGVDRFDIFEFLDRIEDYHPSHLVAWLQSRLVTIEELPAVNRPFQDHYGKLEVPPDADLASIRRAYRKLALLTHPDKPNGDRQRFEEVSRAYEILTDPAQREAHDQERLRRAAALEEAALRTLKLRFRPSRDVASDFGRDLENLTGRAREVLWSAMGSLHSMVAVQFAEKQPAEPQTAAGPEGSNFL